MYKLENVKLICGTQKLNNLPNKIFNQNVIGFLDLISKKILGNKKLKIYPDLISYGFWCRKNNITKIKKLYNQNRLGRGIAFHVCPSNVPMNFAFSMTLGLLAGNSNIVRLPSNNYDQIKELCKIINEIFKLKKFNEIKQNNSLISYKKSENISAIISKISDIRIIWGGDQTVNDFKKFKTKPRCLDLNFSNRYSFSIINSKKFNGLSLIKIKELAKKFYTDTYTMDQNGCSSPKSVFWIGNVEKKKQNFFWKEVTSIAECHFQFDLSKVSNKFFRISKDILSLNEQLSFDYKNFKVVKFKYNSKINFKKIEEIQTGLGVFFETKLTNVNLIKKFITPISQTMTYFGYSKDEIKNIIFINQFKGIDRAVQFGSAFQLSHIWDGYDMINTLSREIDLH